MARFALERRGPCDEATLWRSRVGINVGPTAWPLAKKSRRAKGGQGKPARRPGCHHALASAKQSDVTRWHTLARSGPSQRAWVPPWILIKKSIIISFLFCAYKIISNYMHID